MTSGSTAQVARSGSFTQSAGVEPFTQPTTPSSARASMRVMPCSRGPWKVKPL